MAQLPHIPIDGQASTVIWVAPASVLAWNYDLESAVLDRSGSWKKLENVPMETAECYPRSVLTMHGAVGFCGGIAWFDGVTREWRPFRGPFQTKYAVTENSVIGFVDVARDQAQMIEYGLPPIEWLRS